MKGACFALLRVTEMNATPRRSHWFHTIMITRGELDRVFSNAAMKGRYVRRGRVANDTMTFMQDLQVRVSWHVTRPHV